MRRKDKEINDNKEIEEILTESEIGIVGMVVDDFAYSVPVNFIYYQKAVYFHSAIKGKKIQALKKNKNVSFLTFIDHGVITDKNPCNASQSFKSVMVQGKAEFVKDVYLKQVVLDEIVKKYYKESEYTALNGNDFKNALYKAVNGVEVIKISIDRLSCKISHWND